MDSRPSKLKTALSLLLSLTGLVCQLAGWRSATPVFCYFTWHSNVGWLLLMLWKLARPGARLPPILAGALCAYLIFTGVVFQVSVMGWRNPVEILVPGTGSVPADLGTVILHYATPCVAAVHWFVHRAEFRLPLRAIGLWAIYPAAYLVLMLAWCSWSGTPYPYAFVDPAVVGAAAVVRNCGLFAGAFLVFTTVLVLSGRVRGGRSPGP